MGPPKEQHPYHLEIIRNTKSQALPRTTESGTESETHQAVFAGSPGDSDSQV